MSDINLTGIGMTSQRTRDRLIQRLVEQGISDSRVLDRMAAVPRHIFVDEALAHRAYEDNSLPIGHGQTISQPFIVARMTELLIQVAPKSVLEVGTGCGYQTAILAPFCEKLWSVELLEPLATKARQRLSQLKLRNVRTKVGDGYLGWAVNGPYDGILVAAAPEQVPAALIEQLAVGGRLVIPVGGVNQQLMVIDRTEEGVTRQIHEAVKFVPLVSSTSTFGSKL